MASLSETEIIDCIQVIRSVCIKREETTHVRVYERNIHQHIKKISTMYVNNGHKTHVQE